MTVFVDADACPVTRIVEDTSKQYGIPVVLLCDTNHVLTSDYSIVKIIGAGPDAVDIALINQCHSGDIVVTQDLHHLKGPHKRTDEDDRQFADSFYKLIQSSLDQSAEKDS